MNERIKELAEQCGFRSNPDIYDRNQSFDIPMFAELIIKECGKLLSQPEYIGRSDLDWSMILNEHFGVK
jgi:hypothetical protein